MLQGCRVASNHILEAASVCIRVEFRDALPEQILIIMVCGLEEVDFSHLSHMNGPDKHDWQATYRCIACNHSSR